MRHTATQSSINIQARTMSPEHSGAFYNLPVLSRPFPWAAHPFDSLPSIGSHDSPSLM